MKKYISILFLLFVEFSIAQQLPQFSQYMLNEMAVNPAMAGKDDFSEVRSINRHQWVGITDAPRTYMLTLQGPIKNKNMGVGMNLFTDVVGPTRRTGLNFSYAYHLKINKETNLSMALTAGILQWGIDGNKISLHDEGDQQLYTNYQTTLVPDFGAGIYYYKKKVYYFGLSVPQLYNAPIKLYEGAYKNSRLVTQFNISGGYIFKLNDDFSVEPSFLFKYERPAPAKLDIGARAIYKSQVWIGATYRSQTAVSAMLGYMFDDYLTIGYAYDVSTGRIKKYAAGTHEILLGIKFSKKQAGTWNK
ncbi:MAG: type IX secretion system membrane protein PorP/SprF [Bacteroidota bacterium]